MMWCLMTLVWFAIICRCHCVGVEYYDDKNISPDKQIEHTVSSHPRRVSDGRDSKNVNVWRHGGNNYLTSNAPDDEENRRKFVISSVKLKDDGCKSNLFTQSGRKNVLISSNINVTVLPVDVLNEYDYDIYDDDDMKVQPLRENVPNGEQYLDASHSESYVRVHLNEMYNLQPAVQHVKIKNHDNSSKLNSVWYIMEDVPCWDLPLLYGEIDKKVKSTNVFSMHGVQLKNVFEKSDNKEWISQHKPTNNRVSFYTSKWCTVEPCYGDHTLCLFSDTTMSTLCDKHYEVNVPNILEQAALVNTLNSMRNQIANGNSVRYRHLPAVGNMRQIIYDNDLEQIAKVWLHQCLPGPPPCSALDGTFVTQLECTKYAKYCCVNSNTAKCIPKAECFLTPVIGCLHLWYWRAGDKLTAKDVQCGHTSVSTYSTAQLFWATTYKIGCAYAKNINGDVRVICNFSPGAPFVLDTKLYCGIVGRRAKKKPVYRSNVAKHLKDLGIDLERVAKRHTKLKKKTKPKDLYKSRVYRSVDTLSRIYKEGWIRRELKEYSNGTLSMIARLVTKYEFIEQNGARCDSNEPIYVVASPGSLCVENGRRYRSLCYDYRDPTPGYRLVAVLAPIALFSLILYDLFSGVVRQTNY